MDGQKQGISLIKKRKKKKERLDADATYMFTSFFPFFHRGNWSVQCCQLSTFGSAIICVPPRLCELYGILKVFLPASRQPALSSPLNRSF
jgi:hypothetical protein